MGQDVVALGFPLGQNSLKISKGREHQGWSVLGDGWGAVGVTSDSLDGFGMFLGDSPLQRKRLLRMESYENRGRPTITF